MVLSHEHQEAKVLGAEQDQLQGELMIQGLCLKLTAGGLRPKWKTGPSSTPLISHTQKTLIHRYTLSLRAHVLISSVYTQTLKLDFFFE